MIAFRAAAFRCPHTRPLTRPLTTRSAFALPDTKSKVNVTQATKASAEPRNAQKNQPLRGTDIPYRFVRLVDPETGKLHDPQPLRSILSTINPRSEYVELVSASPEPIVKLHNRYDENTRVAEAALRAREVRRQNVHKEVQLSWTSGPADLAHKINKVREDLTRGVRRVDLVFARKSKQDRLEPAEMHKRASEAIESLQDVAKERKEREMRLPQGILIISLEAIGTAEVSTDSAVTNSQPETSGKKFVASSDGTLAELDNVVRRTRKELSKGVRVEFVVSAEVDRPAARQQLTMDKLHERADELIKMFDGEAKEWQERKFKVSEKSSQNDKLPVKLSLFLEKKGVSTRGKVVKDKGPKPKKIKSSDIPDLYQLD